ncbi:MAG: two-component system, sensor histidine kinase GlnK [Candidatus Petromonas sp.]|jgi:two-component system sensor histidine kinase YcbA|nr:two-component system, sensor histidine kinase GlnK [Candidatus Petromonas sp.]
MIDREKFGKVLIVAVATTLMGQVYINPFNSPFRLSIGITILTFLLLKFHDISIILTTLCTAISVFIFRFSIDLFQIHGNAPIIEIALEHLPSAVFYLVFGMALFELRIRKYKEQPIYFVFLVGISDMVSNVAEAAARHEFTKTSIEIILTSLFLAGFARALIAFMLYSSIKAYNMLILKEEHDKRYRNLLLFTANMRAEVFFLQKTMQDIEKAMERCYSIYADLKNKGDDIDKEYVVRIKERILNLSKDIHEIKKDNQRVVSGIERLLPEVEKDNIMKLSTIFKILSDSTKRYVESIGKDIEIFTNYSVNLSVEEYYSLITVLNNLIHNAIDAIDNEGYISISQYIEKGYVIFQIRDSGLGIKKDDMNVIFEPGFSTKFNKKTGRMSTGIGLTHVKHIIENHYSGKIKVNSEIGKGTTFTIYIPIENIVEKEGK